MDRLQEIQARLDELRPNHIEESRNWKDGDSETEQEREWTELLTEQEIIIKADREVEMEEASKALKAAGIKQKISGRVSDKCWIARGKRMNYFIKKWKGEWLVSSCKPRKIEDEEEE